MHSIDSTVRCRYTHCIYSTVRWNVIEKSEWEQFSQQVFSDLYENEMSVSTLHSTFIAITFFALRSFVYIRIGFKRCWLFLLFYTA